MTILLYLRKKSNMLEHSFATDVGTGNKKGEPVFAFASGGGGC
ncbi:hypothetical protein [Variovorax beijingensis]|nr:hypothetical protein [Variovorax beijingensis]